MNVKKLLIINIVLFIIIAVVVFIIGIFVLENINITQAAEEDDETPPDITDVSITDITATSSVITWETNEDADSLVNYGLDKNYGIIRDPHFNKVEHKIILEDLLPDTLYYYRIISSDSEGNQGISNDFSFITDEDKEPIPPSGTEEDQDYEMDEGYTEESLKKLKDRVKEQLMGIKKEDVDAKLLEEVFEAIDETSNKGALKEVSELLDRKAREGGEADESFLKQIIEMLKELIGEETYDALKEKALEEELSEAEREFSYVALAEVIKTIENILDQESLELIQREVERKAEEIVTPPTIILDYADVEVGTDWAIISWKTDKESNSMISLARESDYDEEIENPYTWNEGHPEEYVTEHVVEINGLSPSTVYHFQVSSKSPLGLTGKSDDKTFKTKSILPEIYNIRLSKIEEDSATVKWTTNVPCSSILEYTNLNINETKLEGNSSFLTVHSMRLTNLIFDTYYSVLIKVESEDGEKAESSPITFITIKDEYPPEITKVNTESTLYPGSDNKIQTIASWGTDEPSMCQLFYHQGLVVVDEAKSQPKEEEYSNKHVQVITNFLPSTVYKFWIVCLDEAENEGRSEDFTMLTPTQEESIIDIIIKNFESSFGWVKKLKI